MHASSADISVQFPASIYAVPMEVVQICVAHDLFSVIWGVHIAVLVRRDLLCQTSSQAELSNADSMDS